MRKLTSIEQGLMAGPNCQAGQGKDGTARVWESSSFYRRGRVRRLGHSSLCRGGAVLESGNLFKGRAAILADSQNGDIIVLSIVYQICHV
jgi:hypothetical protein